MGNDANRAELLSQPAYDPRTGLAQRRHEGGTHEGGRRSGATGGELMRLFVAPDRAHVLWSGLSGDCVALARLADSVAAGATRAGSPPPGKTRRFQPHMTLARCRMPADVTGLVAALAGYQGQPWTADRVHLVRSRLGGTEQPRYSSLASWPLYALDRDTADPAS
jgi:hypothetical protein